MSIKWLFTWAGILLFHALAAQKFELTSINLTVLDGLASNHVYCAMQDNQGYIWFGTETGVSRYNGRKFENFYMSDGLGDNEVFRIDQDSQGRIWFSALNGKLSYYKEGQFFNSLTDEKLGQVAPKTFYLDFFEDSYGNVWLNTKLEAMVITQSGDVKYFGGLEYKPSHITGFFEKDGKVWGVSTQSGSLTALVVEGEVVESLDFQPIDDFDEVAEAYLMTNEVHLYGNGVVTETKYLKEKYPYVNNMDLQITKVHNYPGGDLWLCTYKGVLRIDKHTGAGEKLFDGDIVTHVLIDREGGFWFTFLGRGIEYVTSLTNKSIKLAGRKSNDYVSALLKDGETIWFGGSEGKLGRIRGDHVEVAHLFETQRRDMVKRIIKGVNPGELWVAAESQLVRTEGMKPLNAAFASAKVIKRWGEKRYALGLSGYVMILSEKQIYDGLGMPVAEGERRSPFETKPENGLHFEHRAGFVFDIENYQQGLLISSSLGLFFMDDDYQYNRIDSLGMINERINDILVLNEQDYALATHGHGTYLFTGGKRHHFSEANGLSSDICRKVIAEKKGVFWIATNKGVNRVKIDGDEVKVSGLNKVDGLLSEEVYDLIISDDRLVAATSDGISIINISNWEAQKNRPLMIEPVLSVANRVVLEESPLLDHNAQNIRFTFDGFHFKSLDKLSYEYRIVGLDEQWASTALSFVNVGALASGDYIFEVRAVSAFGDRSPTRAYHFSVDTPLWLKWWFVLTILIGFGLLLTWMVRAIIRYNKRKARDHYDLLLRISEAERKALQAQLNPHFIFNSLNSIQRMVLQKEPEEAYGYLEKFSKLIRRVLQFSDQSMVTLGDELETLRLYMDLEKVRLEDNFDYDIQNEVGSGEFIPAMIIQPYVENAIWHGIMPLNGMRHGAIQIRITRESDELFIQIFDNGIGRVAGLKQDGYGTRLASQLAKTPLDTGQSSVQIEDLYKGEEPAGTRVIIKILTQVLTYD